MEKSTLKPFLKAGLDILFVGLNPAIGSSRNGHYFSVNAAFWNQLYESGLIIARVNKERADEVIFGTNEINYNGWHYGITDLVTAQAESNSRKVKTTEADCHRLISDIYTYQPKIVVLLHSKVISELIKFHILNTEKHQGYLGRCLEDSDTEFFYIPFPHGNSVPSMIKVTAYREVLEHLENSEG